MSEAFRRLLTTNATPTRAAPLAYAGRRRSGLELLWRQYAFRAQERADVWQLLADVLDGTGEELGTMMEAVAEGYVLQGRKTLASVLLEIRAGLGDNDLPDRLRPYCGMTERILFQGLGEQSPGALFAASARLLRGQIKMRQAILGAIFMPLLLVVCFFGLVLFFGISLLPAFAEVIDFQRLPGIQRWIVNACLAVSANPAALGLWMAGGGLALFGTMRWWTGPGREIADQFPPFSLMRLQAGSGFLFAVVEYGRSNQEVTTDLLERLADAAPPYARSRIRAIAREFSAANGNLGEASLRAGQGFPALELVAVLRTLWNKPGGIDRIGDVLERWLERIETTVKTTMAVLNGALLALVAVALLALLSIAMPIMDQINQGVAF